MAPATNYVTRTQTNQVNKPMQLEQRNADAERGKRLHYLHK